MLVMHQGEEPGPQVGTRFPAVLFHEGANQGVLDEIIGALRIPGQCA